MAFETSMNKPNIPKRVCGSCPAKTISKVSQKQKRAIIEAEIRLNPSYSSRRIAERLDYLRVSHKTISKYRKLLIAKGEIEEFLELESKRGRKRKATFNKPPKNDDPIYSCVYGENQDLFREVADLYLKEGDRVADVTFGRGAFWKQIDTEQFEFYPSDIRLNQIDFTCLPYPDSSFDAMVLDPPYVTTFNADKNAYKGLVNERYGLAETTPLDVLSLYRDGLEELFRCLDEGGLAFVKTADFIERHKQVWLHQEVFEMATAVGFEAVDLFILHRSSRPPSYGNQRTARKNHSFLYVFRK